MHSVLHMTCSQIFTKPLQATLFMQMCNKILNLPCSTRPAVHRSVLNLQNFCKGNNEQPTDGQEANGEVDPIKEKNGKTENAPVQKNDDKNKH